MRYAELLRELHGQAVVPRPELGRNPFDQAMPDVEPRVSFSAERYVSPALSGRVTFDCSNNNGRYMVGAGDMLFETAWSGPSSSSIIAYNDPPCIRTIALAAGPTEISEVADASKYDSSSRTRRPRLGEIVLWQNTTGYYLATKIEAVKGRGHGALIDEVTFSYVIAPHKSSDFRLF